jgi:hypothetical protein
VARPRSLSCSLQTTSLLNPAGQDSDQIKPQHRKLDQDSHSNSRAKRTAKTATLPPLKRYTIAKRPESITRQSNLKKKNLVHGIWSPASWRRATVSKVSLTCWRSSGRGLKDRNFCSAVCVHKTFILHRLLQTHALFLRPSRSCCELLLNILCSPNPTKAQIPECRLH